MLSISHSVHIWMFVVVYVCVFVIVHNPRGHTDPWDFHRYFTMLFTRTFSSALDQFRNELNHLVHMATLMKCRNKILSAQHYYQAATRFILSLKIRAFGIALFILSSVIQEQSNHNNHIRMPLTFFLLFMTASCIVSVVLVRVRLWLQWRFVLSLAPLL